MFLAWPVVCAFEAVRRILDEDVVGASRSSVAGFAMTAVLFLVWFERAYENISSLTGREMKRSSAWAALSWLVPLVNVVVPYESFDDILQQTAPRRFRLLGWLWALWIVGGFSIVRTGDHTISAVLDAIRLTCWAVGAVLVRLLVLDVSRSQHELAAAAAAAPVEA